MWAQNGDDKKWPDENISHTKCPIVRGIGMSAMFV